MHLSGIKLCITDINHDLFSFLFFFLTSSLLKNICSTQRVLQHVTHLMVICRFEHKSTEEVFVSHCVHSKNETISAQHTAQAQTRTSPRPRPEQDHLHPRRTVIEQSTESFRSWCKSIWQQQKQPLLCFWWSSAKQQTNKVFVASWVTSSGLH